MPHFEALSGIRIGGSAPSAPVDGQFWTTPATNRVNFSIGPNNVASIVGARTAQTTTRTVANSVTELSLTDGFAVSGTLLQVAKTLTLEAWGFFSRGASTNTINLRFKIGSTTLASTGAFDPAVAGTITNRGWRFRGIITDRTTGAGGTVFTQAEFAYNDDTVATFQRGRLVMMTNTATNAYDTTSSGSVDLTAQWGTAAAANTITCSNAWLEVIS